MKSIIYAIGALVLASSAASAEVVRPQPTSRYAMSASYGPAALSNNGSSKHARELHGASAQTVDRAPQSVDQAGAWDADDNNG